MKSLIFAITLLFSASVMAQQPAPPPEMITKEDMAQFIGEHVRLGLETDEELYLEYIRMIYVFGEPIQQMALAVRYGKCYHLWRHIAENGYESENLTLPMVYISMWRSLMSARLYVHAAGGDPDRTETILLPELIKGNLHVNGGTIVECTALDYAAFQDMVSDNISPFPPADWDPKKPLPESPEPEENQDKFAS